MYDSQLNTYFDYGIFLRKTLTIIALFGGCICRSVTCKGCICQVQDSYEQNSYFFSRNLKAVQTQTILHSCIHSFVKHKSKIILMWRYADMGFLYIAFPNPLKHIGFRKWVIGVMKLSHRRCLLYAPIYSN